jgi:hypothetical protein
MSLERLLQRAENGGRRAADDARNRILRRAELPAGITASAIEGGIVLSGKRLRRRIIEDPKLRNFTR